MVESTDLAPVASARLRQVRKLRELAPVLYDEEYCSKADPELPVYEVYRDCCDEARDLIRKHGLRYDVTVMPPLLLGEEYVKTLGHRHLPCGEVGSHPEIFNVVEGEAQFLIQEQRSQDIIDVSLLVAKEGEKTLIPPGYGHVMINASSRRLVTENLISQNCIQAHDQYVKNRGAAFYILSGGRHVRNPRYSSVPELRMSKCIMPSFLEGSSGLAQMFLNHPDRFAFLNEPSRFAQWKVTA